VVRLTTESGREGPDSHGFCLLNNISIGAAYALNRHREKVKKVAIVDFGKYACLKYFQHRSKWFY
jgi:hypothetical protein